MKTPLALGVLAAIFATFSWALNFVTPYVTGGYTAYDFISLRFLFSGAIGVVFILVYRAEVFGLGWRDVLLAFCLGFIGYVGYFACIMGGVIFAGPVITPAFLGLVPILLAILGNTTRKTLPWTKLSIPLGLAAGGLLLTNFGAFTRPADPPGRSLAIGMLFSIGAVTLWLIFAQLNQIALEKRANLHMGAWTGLMMLGAGVGIVIFLPLGVGLDVFNFPALGFGWASAGHLYLWAFALACVSSVAGAWAWNVASRLLPMVLTGQLISVETLFATAFGLIAQHRLPTLYELSGILMVMAGAVMAVRIVLAPRPIGLPAVAR